MSLRQRRSSPRKSTDLRREEIADAAMAILAQDGHRRFTTKLLAARLGLTEGAIFRHFPTMESIADTVVDRMGEALLPSLEASNERPLERLRDFFRHRASVLTSKPELARLLLSDDLLHAAGEEHAARVGDLRRRSQRFVVDCLAQAKERRQLLAGVSLEAALYLVSGAMMVVGRSAVTPAERQRQIIEDLWRLIERALRGKEASS